MASKKFYESKMFWANILFIVGGVCTALAGELASGSILTFSGVVNLVLRIVTDKALKF